MSSSSQFLFESIPKDQMLVKSVGRSFAPVDGLPFELLSNIFTIAFLSLPPRGRPSFATQIQLVCNRWRWTFNATQCLWTSLKFSAPPFSIPEKYIQLSGVLPLDVDIDFDRIPVQYTNDLLDLLTPTSSRIHNLRINDTCRNVAESISILDRLFASPLPQLSSMTLVGQPYQQTMPQEVRPINAPLQRLELRNCATTWSSPCFNNLLELSVTETSEIMVPLHHMIEALHRCPELRALELHNLDINPMSLALENLALDGEQRAPLHSLERLDLPGFSFPETVAIMNGIDAPNIRHLCISAICSALYPGYLTYWNNLTQRLGAVTQLELADIGDGSIINQILQTLFTNLATSSQSCEHLILNCSKRGSGPSFAEALSAVQPSQLFDQLKRVTLQGIWLGGLRDVVKTKFRNVESVRFVIREYVGFEAQFKGAMKLEARKWEAETGVNVEVCVVQDVEELFTILGKRGGL